MLQMSSVRPRYVNAYGPILVLGLLLIAGPVRGGSNDCPDDVPATLTSCAPLTATW
jgi:hypothetical protein